MSENVRRVSEIVFVGGPDDGRRRDLGESLPISDFDNLQQCIRRPDGTAYGYISSGRLDASGALMYEHHEMTCDTSTWKWSPK